MTFLEVPRGHTPTAWVNRVANSHNQWQLTGPADRCYHIGIPRWVKTTCEILSFRMGGFEISGFLGSVSMLFTMPDVQGMVDWATCTPKTTQMQANIPYIEYCKRKSNFQWKQGSFGLQVVFLQTIKYVDLLIFLGGTEGCYGFDLFCSQGLLLFLQLLNPFRQPNSTIRWRKTKRHWMRRTWVVPSDPCSVAILRSSLCWTASLWKIGQHVFVPL